MSFFSETLKVLLVTTHIPLRDVSKELKPETIVHKSRLFRDAIRSITNSEPRIAVCGLNPHASEDGLFGNEERAVITPAIEQLNAASKGEVFFGPLPSDSVFWRALRGEFDGIVALFHDQGLIPLKMAAFDTAVNVTLGLPIIRCSPDHGTAFDIAGQGVANPSSMISTINWGQRLAAGRRQ
jgi:4-hydroxythreonine-4-phosphate dehydrogenase